MRRIAPLLTLLGALALPSAAHAANFTPASGSFNVDTTTLKLTGSGTNITGVNEGGIAVFRFDTVNIPNGVQITATGNKPFELVASGNLTLGGFISSSGGSPLDRQAGPFAGGAGGGAGGASMLKGAGPGGGGAPSTSDHGGGGGGFGGAGAAGGRRVDGGSFPGTGGTAGPAYGNLNGLLQGGSGGGGGATSGGGGGGGAVALLGQTVTITATGQVRVSGGSGSLSGGGASGGGSGGAIVVHGDTVDANGQLIARGGDGGMGSCCGDGGGGGGGRIAFQYRTLLHTGSTQVNGGQSGLRNTGGGNSPGGGVSPSPFGTNGVVTQRQAASNTTTPATGVSAGGATLNATVNPHSTVTNFFFQYGTTTAYGANTPGTSAGSGNGRVPVAAAIGGLAPSTTYHYRVVTLDVAGFTTIGADAVFTTAAGGGGGGGGTGGTGGGGSGGVLGGGGSGGGPIASDPVSLTVAINSLAFPSYTKLLNLTAKSLKRGYTVTVTCKTKKKKQQKKGCPFKSKRFIATGSKLSLKKAFAKKKIPVGTKVVIKVTMPGFFPKLISYTFRAGKLPKSKVQCQRASGKLGGCG